jgi:hypothetical protein
MHLISLTRCGLHRHSQSKTHHTSGLRNSRRSLSLHIRQTVFRRSALWQRLSTKKVRVPTHESDRTSIRHRVNLAIARFAAPCAFQAETRDKVLIGLLANLREVRTPNGAISASSVIAAPRDALEAVQAVETVKQQAETDTLAAFCRPGLFGFSG